MATAIIATNPSNVKVCVACGGEFTILETRPSHIRRRKFCSVECAGKSNTTHGRSKSGAEYTVWKDMRRRCRDPKHVSYATYGGRGIVVCDRWQHSFEAFLADMGGRPTPNHSIDRIDNDKGYEPGNCQWQTFGEQMRNRRSNIRVTYMGKEMILSDAAKLAGVKYTTAKARYHRGLPIAEVLAP